MKVQDTYLDSCKLEELSNDVIMIKVTNICKHDIIETRAPMKFLDLQNV